MQLCHNDPKFYGEKRHNLHLLPAVQARFASVQFHSFFLKQKSNWKMITLTQWRASRGVLNKIAVALEAVQACTTWWFWRESITSLSQTTLGNVKKQKNKKNKTCLIWLKLKDCNYIQLYNFPSQMTWAATENVLMAPSNGHYWGISSPGFLIILYKWK